MPFALSWHVPLRQDSNFPPSASSSGYLAWFVSVLSLLDESVFSPDATRFYRDFPGPVGFSGELSSEHLWWVLFAVCLQVVSPASVGGYFPLIVVKHRLRLNQLVCAGICQYFVLWDESFLDLHPTPSYRDFPEGVGFESFCLNIFGLLLAVCFQVVSPASVGGYCPLNFVVKHRSEAAPGSLRLLSVVL